MAETSVEVKLNERELREAQRMLSSIPNAMPKMITRAINKTATSAKTEIARRIGREIVLSQKRIKQNISLMKATYNRWEARISIKGKRIPLIHFGAKQVKTGITYKISRTEGRKKISYHPETSPVFITMLASGHKGVFKRLLKRRLPILELLGPSIPGVFEKAPGVAIEVVENANKKLAQNIDAQVKYILDRAG